LSHLSIYYGFGWPNPSLIFNGGGFKMKISIEELRQEVERYVDAYPQKYNETHWWRTPLVSTATVDDRFKRLREIAAKNHWMPEDLLPTAKTVIVIFFPFKESLVKENHPSKFPCPNWGIAYEVTNELIERTIAHLEAFLKESGYESALTAAASNPDADEDDDTMAARWSHKHLGYLCDMGRFGINAQFITPSGCSGRMGSMVTDADIGNHPLVSKKELCLHKNGQECLQCVARCPVKAVSVKDGIHRQRCNQRLHFNWHNRIKLGLGERSHGCAKCQVHVPCSLSDPSEMQEGKMLAS
jgi:epoxyqueuosine reductase QueG